MANLDRYSKRRLIADNSDRALCDTCYQMIEPGDDIYIYTTGRQGGDPYKPRQHVICPPRPTADR